LAWSSSYHHTAYHLRGASDHPMSFDIMVTITVFWGWPETETLETQLEKGSIPSRATAKTRREAARTAMAVLNHKVTTERTIMTMWLPFLKSTA